MKEENLYICEECNFKSDKQKLCHGKKMVNINNTIKFTNNLCGCD